MTKKCEKCGYELTGKNNLCSVCSRFAPSDPSQLKEYVKEKLNWKLLETFRKFGNKNIKRMEDKAREGKIMSRAPFGYKIESKQLVKNNENNLKVEEIFRTFLEQDVSLNQLAKQFGFSVNGLKKILRNFTYIGKIKFKGQIIEGKHKAIITPELFNKVQNKLEKLGIS